MKKTIFTATPYDESRVEKEIIRMVRNHNAGKVEIDIELIMAYIKGEWAQWIPSKETVLKHNIGDKILEVWEGETLVMTVAGKEIYELAETEDDLKGVIPMSELDQEIETELNKLT